MIRHVRRAWNRDSTCNFKVKVTELLAWWKASRLWPEYTKPLRTESWNGVGNPACRGHHLLYKSIQSQLCYLVSTLPMIIFTVNWLSLYHTVFVEFLVASTSSPKTDWLYSKVANPQLNTCHANWALLLCIRVPGSFAFTSAFSILQCAPNDLYSVIRHPISWILYLYSGCPLILRCISRPHGYFSDCRCHFLWLYYSAAILEEQSYVARISDRMLLALMCVHELLIRREIISQGYPLDWTSYRYAIHSHVTTVLLNRTMNL